MRIVWCCSVRCMVVRQQELAAMVSLWLPVAVSPWCRMLVWCLRRMAQCQQCTTFSLWVCQRLYLYLHILCFLNSNMPVRCASETKIVFFSMSDVLGWLIHLQLDIVEVQGDMKTCPMWPIVFQLGCKTRLTCIITSDIRPNWMHQMLSVVVGDSVA